MGSKTALLLLTTAVIISILLSSCHHDHHLRIAQQTDEPNKSIINLLVPLLKTSEENIHIEILSNEYAHIDSLKNGSVDVYITDNNASYDEELRAVAPLFPEVLHILHKKNYQPQSLQELLEGKKIFSGLGNSQEYNLCKKLIHDFKINAAEIEFVHTNNQNEADVIFLFTDLVSATDLKNLNDYQFFSLDDPSLLGSGTIAEAISIRNPGLTPFIIPKATYADFSPFAILTLKSESILICKENLDQHMVYEISRLITENKQRFFSISPLMHKEFEYDFEKSSSVYPLHLGTKNFLDRNKPTFIQRNAETIGVIVTLMIGLISGFFTYRNYMNHKKKDKIDIYYGKLDKIRHNISSASQAQLKEWLIEIRTLESETIELLIKEKLSANDSYLVFMRLVDLTRRELKDALNELDSKGIS